MHEPVFEDRLGNPRRAFGKTHQGHELRLQVGGKAGIGVGGDVRRLRHAVGGNPHAVILNGNRRAGVFQDFQKRVEMPWPRAGQRQITAGDQGRDGEGPGFDAVGNDGMLRVTQGLHALDRNRVGPVAGDARAHGVQAFGKVHDLRLARDIDEFRGSLRQRRRDQGVFGRADRDHREHHPRAGQARRGSRLDIAVGKFDHGAKRLHGADVQVDRPRADGASARK